MKPALAFLVLCACGGPSQQQIVETPAATAPWPHSEAPPASTSDEERHELTQTFDDMDTTQRAYQQAEGAQQQKAQQTQPLPGQPAPPTKKKKGVAEQAPPQPKKKGVAEQAK